MRNGITLGHPEAHEKLTARLYWRAVGDAGFVDAGNVREYSDASTRSTVSRARSQDGARHVDDEQTDLAQESYSFLLDERVPEQEKLIRLAKPGDRVAQANGEGSTATLEEIELGCWYGIGAYNVANAQAFGSAAGPLTEGDDYDIDLPNGRILIKKDGKVSSGETVNLTFDQPSIGQERIVSQSKALFYCDLVIEEHNQFAGMWLRRLELKACLNVQEFPSQTGEFVAYRVKATATGPVLVNKRPAAPLPTLIESGPPAASSSSSSLSSSSKSSESSHSSQSSSSYSSQSSSSSSNSSSSNSSNSSSSSTVASLTSSSSSSSTIASVTSDHSSLSSDNGSRSSSGGPP